MTTNIKDISTDDLPRGYTELADEAARLAYSLDADDIARRFRLADSGQFYTVVPGPAWSRERHEAMSSGPMTFVSDVGDFPTPIGGVITLPAGTSWFIVGTVAMGTNKIVCDGPVAFLGASAETSFLTFDDASGTVTDYCIESAYNLPMHYVAFTCPEARKLFRVYKDGANPAPVLDWFACNFSGGALGDFIQCDNFIAYGCGWFDCQGPRIEGTVNSLVIETSIGVMWSGGKIWINIDPSALVNRRIRIERSVCTVGTGTTGIRVDSANIANAESCQLEKINFSGTGTYVTTLTASDLKARFLNCPGIPSSARIGHMYWEANATETTVTQNAPAKAVGTSVAGPSTQKFDHTNGRLTYKSKFTNNFKVSVTASCQAGNSHQLRVQVYKNGVPVMGVSNVATTRSSGAPVTIPISGPVELAENDYIEVFVTNLFASKNITVSYLAVTATEII